ncbi:hypothetical protein [Pseudonocardia sp. NPDC049154]|uniref:hypothetical protein n=1 Tax=Pseudonocardia sp. NPDC049154 TaxID=3155501 RepID=UPI003409F210
MSNARDRVRSLRARDVKPGEDDSGPAETPDPKIRERSDPNRRVRQTVDLSEQRHKELAAWRMETALALGVTRVTTQDVLAAAVNAILRDPTVARHVRAQIETEKEQEELERRRAKSR